MVHADPKIELAIAVTYFECLIYRLNRAPRWFALAERTLRDFGRALRRPGNLARGCAWKRAQCPAARAAFARRAGRTKPSAPGSALKSGTVRARRNTERVDPIEAFSLRHRVAVAPLDQLRGSHYHNFARRSLSADVPAARARAQSVRSLRALRDGSATIRSEKSGPAAKPRPTASPMAAFTKSGHSSGSTTTAAILCVPRVRGNRARGRSRPQLHLLTSAPAAAPREARPNRRAALVRAP